MIEGELFASKAPGLTHQNVSMNLAFNLRTFLRENPIGHLWLTPGVVFSEISGVIPDIVYVSKERLSEVVAGERITAAPDLSIEIVSPGAENEKRDRVAKRRLYGQYGVKEYWVVDPFSRTVDIYHLRGNSLRPQATYREGDVLVSLLLPSFSCKVEDIFRG